MFQITLNKGFAVTFPNGWTVSVQFGPGNYCHNRDLHDHEMRGKGDFYQCANAEIAAYRDNADGRRAEWYTFPAYEDGDTVRGWVNPLEVLDFMQRIAALPVKGTEK
jgi:hypothetical protein